MVCSMVLATILYYKLVATVIDGGHGVDLMNSAFFLTDRHFRVFFSFFLYVCISNQNAAPSFVPRDHGVISPMPKNVIASKVFPSSRNSNRPSNQIKMMPIGVPKVAYRVPGSQSADW